MIAQIELIKNWKEIDKAQAMNISSPEEEHEYKTFGFQLDDVGKFHLEDDNKIVLIFSDRTFVIKYEESIYQELLNKFK